MTLLRDPENLDGLASTPTPLHLALTQGRAELARHGFQATVSVADGIEQLDPVRSEALGAVASEAISNMIKHADPSGLCAIIVDVSESSAELVFLNRPRRNERTSSTLSLGLLNLREALEPLGGSLHTESQPTQWMTRATLPIAGSLLPPEKVA
jgi:signal transduction histidine kinase